MTISKTKNSTYRLRLYIPDEVKPILGISTKMYEKTFKTRKEAKQAELEWLTKIDKALSGEIAPQFEIDGNILFSDFFHTVWWESYKAGQTTSTNRPPTTVTIENTATVFKKHILPMLGNYSLDFLNQNKQVILNLMTAKANEYANFKTLRSYVNSMFDWAEELEYIEANRVSKTLKRIKAIKKIQLQEAKQEEDLYLSQKELKAWLKAIASDLEQGKLEFKDYVLFFTTFFLSDRKSESYALEWRHIDFTKEEIHLVQALDRNGNIKSTKGNKKTIFKVPKELIAMLQSWKMQQKQELSKFNIIQTERQLVFTYIDTKGNVNKPLHNDYLNYRMQAIEKRHPELVHATPHKLRHTGATLAKQAGMSLEAISEALTHSDTITTKTYVNTSNVVPMAVGEIAYRHL
ncbi:TPA: site-specific integrase [Streptococcus equi subsp. zooepidemicus]|nr:site-specific integrase [Streptococcus equi subsp. zooepidemicus]HEL0429286.1 site-specific integrase [Streptococcus equi subsp. zooepidemicus]HEL0431421.1 site-specific integrase [Streptococcus equi subsp. zooepidemicus]HEL0435546.1 site-specific integrase [Streptococcus equi subsp. zooepidemicus]HEL0439658.1 site-specific integrase [Streptococcus equi subsp. zooepidemicus]